MGNLSEQIGADLKEAMIAGDKQKVSVLRGLKSVIQYAEVAAGSSLTNEAMIEILQKESKKRSEAGALYSKAGDKDRHEAELYEKNLIDQYLPKALSESEINKLIDEATQEEVIEPKNMGKIIANVKQASKGAAEGSLIAQLVKARIQK